MINEQQFDDFDRLIKRLLSDSQTSIEQALSNNPRCSLLLSGGTTPAPFYRQLAKQSLAWHNIDIGLVDERWVAPTHIASNEKLLRENMLIARATPARFVAMKNAAPTAQQGQAECSQNYQAMAVPALCILGMGNDGHTASLFPAAKGLEAGLDKHNDQACVAISAKPSEVTGDYTERMSLTISAIKRSHYIALIICGEKKWHSYQQAKLLGDVEAMPVRALLHDPNCCVNVYYAPS